MSKRIAMTTKSSISVNVRRRDMDWMSRTNLVAYEVIGQGKEQGANLVANVKLTLQDASGSQSEKTVAYTVGTTPKLTVFRNMEP